MGLIRDLFNTDTWANVLSSVGVRGKDRRRDTTIDVDPVTEEEARNMWRTDFLSRACITKVPENAFREGFNISIKAANAKKLAEAVQTRIEELDIVSQFVQAAKFERAYGGAGLFPVLIDGTNDFASELRVNLIQRCTAVHVFEPRELQVATWYDDILHPKWRKPKTYRLQPANGGSKLGFGAEIHESRLVVLPGIRISNDQTIAERPGWGDNALTVGKQTLADFGISMGSVSAMLDQFSQGVLSLNGLGQMLATDEGKQVRDRLTLMDQAKSALRTLVIDKEDTFTREDVSFAGVGDMMRLHMYIVAACLDLPVALLFGMEPAGMNATGAFDIRSFYDRVGNVQTSQYETPMERLIRMTTFLPKDGPTGGKEPDQWSLEWKPLWQMSDSEREETRKVRTDNDVAIINAQIATSDEIRKVRYGGDTFSYETQLVGDAPVPELDPAHVAQLEATAKGERVPSRGSSDVTALVAAVLDEPPTDEGVNAN